MPTTPKAVDSKTDPRIPELVDQYDVARILKKPVRFVREKLFKTKKLPAFKAGGNSWRLRLDLLLAAIDSGDLGLESEKASGRGDRKI